MKVFIMTDMEGVAGVTSFNEDAAHTGRFYNRSRGFLTQEVNAAVEGALAGGATEVVVADGHGGGGVDIQDLHPDAKLIHGSNFPKPSFGLDTSFDALMQIGAHSMSGTPDGNLNHSYSHISIDWIKVNGIEMGEIGVFATVAGAMDVPFIFVSGDKAACREAKGLVANVETAAVKEGINQDRALTLHPIRARELIRKHAEIAVKRAKEIKPYKLTPPYDFVKRYNLSGSAFGAFQYSDVEPIDSKTYRIRDNDLLALLAKNC